MGNNKCFRRIECINIKSDFLIEKLHLFFQLFNIYFIIRNINKEKVMYLILNQQQRIYFLYKRATFGTSKFLHILY